MFHWAHGAMVHACDLLNLSFGSKACKMSDEGQDLTGTPKPETVYLTFEPARGGDDARCSCPGVERYVRCIAAGGRGFSLSPRYHVRM